MSLGKMGFGACVAFIMACGGAITSIDDGGPNSDSGTDSSTLPDGACTSNCTPPPNGCPVSPPANNATCSSAQDQIRCEYGSNPEPDCNQMFFCTQGHWQDQSSGTICAPQSECPSSYAAVPQNQDCTPLELTCAYPQGECICTTSFGGVEKQTPSWSCLPVENGCPSPRADLGTPCSTENLQCDYGGCMGGVDMQCKDGVWQELITPCPG